MPGLLHLSGSLVAFVLWIYYSSLILFFRVELTQVRVTRLRNRVVPDANADLVLLREGADSS